MSTKIDLEASNPRAEFYIGLARILRAMSAGIFIGILITTVVQAIVTPDRPHFFGALGLLHVAGFAYSAHRANKRAVNLMMDEHFNNEENSSE